MPRTDHLVEAGLACLAPCMPIRVTGQKTGSEGSILQDFRGLPSWVDPTPLVVSPKISIEIFFSSSVFKKRAYVGCRLKTKKQKNKQKPDNKTKE